jgi:hypothetical protein
LHACRSTLEDPQPAVPFKNLGNFALYQNFIFINEKNKGVHVVRTNEANIPELIGFIPIPGNLGVAVRNNMLYADSYADLFIIDILQVDQAKLISVMEGIFKSRINPHGFNDTVKVVVDWIRKDTTVTQNYIDAWSNIRFVTLANNAESTSFNDGVNSTGSSMAVFALVNHYLYAVDNSQLYSFDVSTPSSPILKSTNQINWDVETIFPFKDKLFIGTRTGMYIYGLENPASPTYLSMFSHANVCDPVIADDKYAYVTLRSGTQCQGFTNQMEVLDIQEITNPKLVATYPMHNPHGLSKDGHILFICDGTEGLKLYNALNPTDIKFIKTLSIGKAIDVIAIAGNAIVITEDKLLFFKYQQDYTISQTGSINKR